MPDEASATGSRPGPSTIGRALGAALISAASLGTSLCFLFVAVIYATFNCEDGCPPGSPWAPGAIGSEIELWALAAPATAAACLLTCTVALGRRRTSLLMWLVMTALLIGWCVYTGVSSVPIDFSDSNSHWMWLAGLLVAGGGGLVGTALLFIPARQLSNP